MNIPAIVPKTMRAWAIDAHGGPEQLQLRELRVPVPKPRDVLVHMYFAEVGDWDILVREGTWPMNRPFPLILGLAGAGTVAAIGSEVKDFAEGDVVYTYSYPLHDNGAWAEYMLVPDSYVARVRASLDLTRAGAVPIVSLTAHECLTSLLEVQRGDVVLITAAAGGVGHLAVQMAARLGAHVVATAGRQNHDFVRDLGATTVIDYASEDVVDAIRSKFPNGVDKVLNGVGGDTAKEMVRTLRPGGRMIDLTGSASILLPGIHVDVDYIVKSDGDRLARLAQMIDSERIVVEIQEVIPFECAPHALEVIAAKHVRGKLVLKIV